MTEVEPLVLATAALQTEMLNVAGAYRKLTAAKWLRQQGAEWPAVLKYESRAWNTDVVQWARDEGCTSPTTPDTPTAATKAAAAAAEFAKVRQTISTSSYSTWRCRLPLRQHMLLKCCSEVAYACMTSYADCCRGLCLRCASIIAQFWPLTMSACTPHVSFIHICTQVTCGTLTVLIVVGLSVASAAHLGSYVVEQCLTQPGFPLHV
jgi:hypothetical protein